jgi:hypothetical protein
MQINEADVAELVDARDLKSLDGNVVRVRVPPPAPKDRLTGRSAAVTAMWVFRLWDYVARCLRTSPPHHRTPKASTRSWICVRKTSRIVCRLSLCNPRRICS